jgi:RNA polymerase sigma-70 factor, ECF subfamily
VTESASASRASISSLLTQWSQGDRGALDRLVPLVYAELRKIAARQLRRQPRGAPVEPTDLVHALFVPLVDQRHARWENRAHFYAVAAQMMRRILVDHARARLAAKRGGSAVTVSLSDAAHLAGSSPERTVCDVLAIDKALERLASQDPEQVRIVEFRFFAGLSVEETAAVLGLSPRTIKREWRLAKAWLFRELRKDLLRDDAR